MTASRWMRAAAALTLVLTACSDGSGGDAAPDQTSTSSTERPTTSTPVFTGDADSAFCRLLAESEDEPVLDPFEAGLESSEVELRFRALQLRTSRLADAAPPELEDDIDALAAALDDLGAQLDAVDHDFGALAESGADLGAFDDPSFTETAARIDAYRRQVCG